MASPAHQRSHRLHPTRQTKGRLEDVKGVREHHHPRHADGSKIRVKDVSPGSNWAARTTTAGLRANGKPAIGIATYPQTGANAGRGRRSVRRHHGTTGKGPLPAGYGVPDPHDTTGFVKISIEEVVHTLFEASCWCSWWSTCSLQNFRATLIPVSRCRCHHRYPPAC